MGAAARIVTAKRRFLGRVCRAAKWQVVLGVVAQAARFVPQELKKTSFLVFWYSGILVF